MSGARAFVHRIKTEGSGQGEDGKIHQASPHWVLTFVRWTHRDTLRTNPSTNSSDKAVTDWHTTRGKTLVVENDCLQVTTSVNKSTLTHSMNAALIMTDVNYMTEVAPGDFVIVNMLNWPAEARRVADQARLGNTINHVNDGFKGVFKVQSVRKVLQNDPTTGAKMQVFRITGFAFTEFNNTIYFQPEMLNAADKESISLYVSNIGANWKDLVGKKALTNAQDIVASLINAFIGSGVSDEGTKDKDGNIKSPNTLFYIPQSLGKLLGVPAANSARDVYNYLFGIQQYGSNGATLGAGMNPSNLDPAAKDGTLEGRFHYTTDKCRGESVLKPEYWNQVKVWAIVNQFANMPLNELFTTFRLAPNNRVMPTVVMRQIPFNNDDFKAGNSKVTNFTNLPRWKPDVGMVLSLDIGRDESARINFVQVFGRSTLTPKGFGVSEETARKNYLYDIDDVKRSGLKPYVISTTFDITNDKQEYESPAWARILGDCLIGGHLKLNGTFELMGVVDPIAVGDNFEFDGTIFHIEEVQHICQYNGNGTRSFRTRVSVSSGISVNSNTTSLKYTEMDFGGGQQKLGYDWQHNQILPGQSESQATVYRPENVDGPLADPYGFVQPNNGVNINNSTRDPSAGGTDGTGEGGDR